MCVGGEFLCMRTELRAIPVSMNHPKVDLWSFPISSDQPPTNKGKNGVFKRKIQKFIATAVWGCWSWVDIYLPMLLDKLVRLSKLARSE